MGDGAGISSLNAAGIYGYGKPQALYLQQMPHVALVDTSTSKEWVTDAAAAATAWATGRKGRNGVVSETPDAERGVKDGETLKTVLEYAEERGLSTGIISNDDRTGVTIAITAAFYAHSNNRQLSGDIFLQMLNPRFGNGPDVVIGTGRKWIGDAVSKMGHNLGQEIQSKDYVYLDSLNAVAKLDPSKDRVVALFDDTEFDFNQAVEQAVARLSKNPKGYLLIAFSDCHLGKSAKSLSRIVELDKAVQSATEKHRGDTLILMTADHSYDLRIKGEALVETAVTATPQQIAAHHVARGSAHGRRGCADRGWARFGNGAWLHPQHSDLPYHDVGVWLGETFLGDQPPMKAGPLAVAGATLLAGIALWAASRPRRNSVRPPHD